MNKITAFIESGILELYVLGLASAAELNEVEKMALEHSEIRNEIISISNALESYSRAQNVSPHAAIKPMLLATIDYMERLKSGEPMSFPPVLNENSSVDQYAEWLKRKDLELQKDFDEIFVKIIGSVEGATTAIVWIKNIAPHEVHHNEFEKFFILEGSCEISVGEQIHKLVPGDYFQIPLHVGHSVKVTSTIPCKVILQRVAA